MEYTKQTWTAPTGTGLSRYAKSGETDTHIELALDPVNLTNTPTPFTAERMAYMEEGIAKAYDTAPPTPWAQYSGKDIPQLPDNVAGTTYKRDNDWVTTDGWTASGGTVSVDDNKLICFSSTIDFFITKSGFSFSGASNRFIYLYLSEVPAGNNAGQVYYSTSGHGISASYYKNFTITKKGIYILDMGVLSVGGNDWITSTITSVRIDLGTRTGQTFIIPSIYIGTGAYDRLVFDNSYHYRHLLNNAVVPTPQGLYFNGETSYLRSKEKITLPDVFTFSATVNCAIKSATQLFFSQGGQSTAIPFTQVFRMANTDNLVIQGSNGTVAVNAFIATNFFTGLDNTDIKIETSIDFINKTIKVYRNNIQFGSAVSTPTMLKPVTDNIYFGNSATVVYPLLGYMRNICLFDTALTDTQRNWLAQGNTPPILYDVTNYKLGNAGSASKANVRVSLRHGNMFFAKTWSGFTNFYGDDIWTDGDNIYYSAGIAQYVLNKATSTWCAKTWSGLTAFNGRNIWTDGENIYNSDGTRQHVLNKSTSTWTAKTWGGLNSFRAEYIWTDGDNIYYSEAAQQFVLNKTTATWVAKTWTGLTNFDGKYIWTDGENIYYNNVTTQFVLNKVTSTWVVKTWKGLTDFHGENIWTDGENIYYSYTTQQFVLNKTTSTWVVKTWTGLPAFSSNTIWTDGDNIYYSDGTPQHVLPATRHNYVDDDKYHSLFGIVTECNCSTLSNRFVFRNE